MIRRHLALLPFALALFAALPARAEVTAVEIRKHESYAGGKSFGAVGAYERLTGTVRFAVDPRVRANQRVIDLDLAPRNGEGRVEFSADLEILTPADRSRGNGTLLYDVNNRGGGTALGMFNGGDDDFLMRQGYTVVNSGWIAEVQPGGGRFRLHAPVARERNGAAITGLVRAEMVPDAPAKRLSIAQWGNQGSYPLTERGMREATLTVRLREKDPRTLIPAEHWRLETVPARPDGDGATLPDIFLTLNEGFRPGYIYEFIYEAHDPIVQGLGLAGIRDLVSFLKRDGSARNPLRQADGKPAMRRAIGFGVSQSGRALRMLVYDGFNADEQGKQVFDAVWPHVAGGGLGFFNHRFASPTRHNAQHDHHLYPADVFPFAYGDEKDPFTGRTDGLLRRARAEHVVPKVFHTQTSSEYWNRSGSLVHTDPMGTKDAVVPPEVRIYTFGGCQHGPGNGIPGNAGSGQLPPCPTDYRPLLRGLLVALEAWVRHDLPPPPSRYPRIADGTLVPWRLASSGWHLLPGVNYPEVIQQPEWLDRGPEFERYRRTTVQPPAHRGDYRVLVPAYAADDNDRGTLQLPTVAVPLGTFTGWNLRSPSLGADTELLSLTGGYVPFPTTAADARAHRDPREPVHTRYPTYDGYLTAFRASCDRLIRDRLLLEEDRPHLLSLADHFRSLWER